MNLVGLVNSFSIYSNFFGFKKWYVFKDVLGFVQYVAMIKSKQNLFVWSLNLPKKVAPVISHNTTCVLWGTWVSVGFLLELPELPELLVTQLGFTWVTWGTWTTLDTRILLELPEVSELLLILAFYLGYLRYLNYLWY